MENLKLGKCCICEQENDSVRNIVCLHKQTLGSTDGWGCFQCDLPMIGAVAVLCDKCLESEAEPKFYCIGYPGANVRGAVADLTTDFDHDISKHPEQWGAAIIHFESVRKIYFELRNTPGVDVTLALECEFNPLIERFNLGERSKELFEAMMNVE